MSLDPGNRLGQLIRDSIMKRIGDPYYGAGTSGGRVRRVGAGTSGGRVRRVGAGRSGGVIHGGDGACFSKPYMGYPGNVGAGHRKAPKRKAAKRGGNMKNPWQKHLAMVRKQNPGFSVGEISKIASASY
jgi:hypothetical protein